MQVLLRPCNMLVENWRRLYVSETQPCSIPSGGKGFDLHLFINAVYGGARHQHGVRGKAPRARIIALCTLLSEGHICSNVG